MIRPPVPRVPDAELLARFARHRDEAAFELLVWRYHRLVSGVCRRTAGDHHAAEDAAQAAFLLLARRADRVRDAAALPGWLARVAYRCAVRARRAAGVSRLMAVAGNRTPPARDSHQPADAGRSADPESLELFAALDAELDRLPDRLRLPVVLVHLDGRTYADAAAALGVPVGTLSGRLRHARALLKDRLTRRGLAPLAVPAAVAADPARVAAVTRAALAFAVGHPAPDRPAALALGVLRAMTLPKLVAGGLAGLTVAVAAAGLAATQPLPPAGPSPAARPATDLDRLQGEWLFDAATDQRGNDALRAYWNARLTFRKDTVAISHSPYSEAPIETTFTLDPTTTPKRMDWVVPEFYRTLLKLPAGQVAGIYEWDGDGLRVCMADRPGGERPTDFKADAAKGHFLFRVERWRDKPGEKLYYGRLRVTDPAGRPVVGADLYTTTQRVPPDGQRGERLTFAERDKGPTDDTGTAYPPSVPDMARWTVRHAGRRLIAFVPVSPAKLHRGLTVALAPESRVTGRLTGSGLGPGVDVGWTNVYLLPAGGPVAAWAGYADTTGRFEFAAPPGRYLLRAYGERVGGKLVPLTVPADTPEVDAGVIELPANAWGRLIGKPNPGLPGVAKWVGTPSPPDALKGKVVLLYFPNVGHRDPKEWKREAVVAAHEKYAGRGLAVVGVYGDATGETLNAAAAMIGLLKLPFPVALATGVADDWGMHLADPGRTKAAAAYGAESYPHGVLIDRRGVVRGRWLPDNNPSTELLEKLLAEK